jgi:flagellar hook protein FlgE
MLGSIYAGLAGMTVYSDGLKTISNNVGNLNTAGFKAATVRFEQTTSGGVRLGSALTDFGQGELRTTNGDLDLAIDGEGFLVVLNGDTTRLIRTGQFEITNEGFIELIGTDFRLAMLDTAGTPVPINIDDHRSLPPVATTKIEFVDNLSIGATQAQKVSNITVYDANGKAKVWRVEFTRNQAGEWAVNVFDGEGEVDAPPPGQSRLLKFMSGGAVVDPTTATLTINDNGHAVILDFNKTTANVSSGDIVMLRASADGSAPGTLTTTTIDEEGRFKLTYSNGKTEFLGSIALADVREPQGLENLGSGFYELGGSQVRYLASGSIGVGKVLSKHIESSNVDLAQQFGDLILIQRGFQASSQVVSVTNEMIQQLFGIRGNG